MRSGDEGTGHVDGFAIALNAMMKFLDNEDDLMLALDVTDQDGRDILKQIKRDEGRSIFEMIKQSESCPSRELYRDRGERRGDVSQINMESLKLPTWVEVQDNPNPSKRRVRNLTVLVLALVQAVIITVIMFLL